MLRLTCLLLLVLAPLVLAHTPLTDGPTKPARYSTWKNALTIPTNKKSLSARRYLDCAAQFFWLKYTGKKGDPLSISAGTSGAVGLAGIRISAAVFGPGLPKPKRKFAFGHPRTAGAAIINGPRDVSSCKFLPKADQSDYEVLTVGGKKRCGRLEAAATSSFFPLLNKPWKLPASGTFYIAFFPQNNYNGRFYIGTGSITHLHNDIKLPTPPKGNAGTDNQFWDRIKAKSRCCKKGVSLAKCPRLKIFA